MSEPTSDSAEGREQVRGSTLLLAGQVFATAVNLATQILIVRYLTKSDYGAFAFAIGIVVLGEVVSGLGLRRATTRFLPAYEERGDLARAAGAIVFIFSTVLGIGLAVVLLVIGLRDPLTSGVGTGEAGVLLAILIVLSPLQAFETILDHMFAVFGRARTIVMRKHVFAPLMRLAVVGLLVASASGVKFLAVGYVVAGAIGLVVYGWMLVGALRQRGLLAPIRERRFDAPKGELLRYTVPLLSNDLANNVRDTAPVVLLGTLAAAADVADYRAVYPVSATMAYVLTSFGLLFVPLVSRLIERGRRDEVHHLYWRTSLWTAVFSLPIFLLAFAFAEPLTVLLFGERYREAGSVLAWLIAGQFASATLGPNSLLLEAYGEVRYVFKINIATTILNLAISFPLVHEYGATGAAAGTAITLVTLNVARQVGVFRKTDVRRPADREMTVYALIAASVLVVCIAGSVLHAPLWVGAPLSFLAWLVVLRRSRHVLAVAETFPELARVPGLRVLLR